MERDARSLLWDVRERASAILRFIAGRSREDRRKAQAILGLYDARKSWIVEAIPSQYAVRALDWIFKSMKSAVLKIGRYAEVPVSTARRILRLARDGGLLGVLVAGSGRRGTVLIFPELLNIVEGGEVF